MKRGWHGGCRRSNQVFVLTRKSCWCLSWWVSPSGFEGNSTSNIRELAPTLEIWSDANLDMCGSHNSRGQFTQREWSAEELSHSPHINLLECRAAKEGVASLAVPGDRVRLWLDSTTAASYIRRQGGTKSHSLAQEAVALWEDAINRDVEL